MTTEEGRQGVYVTRNQCPYGLGKRPESVAAPPPSSEGGGHNHPSCEATENLEAIPCRSFPMLHTPDGKENKGINPDGKNQKDAI